MDGDRGPVVAAGCHRAYDTHAARFADADQSLAWLLVWPCRSAKLDRLDERTRASFIAAARRTLAVADLSWSFVFNIYVASR